MQEEPEQPPRAPTSPPEPVRPEQLWVDAEWWRGMLEPGASPADGPRAEGPSGGAAAAPAADDSPGELPLPDDASRTTDPRSLAEPAAPSAPAVPQRRDVHVPRVRRRPETVPLVAATWSPDVVRPPRRGVREVVGPRVADAGLLLLALVVVLLVFLALAG